MKLCALSDLCGSRFFSLSAKDVVTAVENRSLLFSNNEAPARIPARSARAKKILLVHLDSLFPKVMASQERVYRMAERLARDHFVDIATTVRDDRELQESSKYLAGVCRTFYPIAPINPLHSQLKRKIRRVEYYLHRYLFHHPHHYFYGGHRTVMAQLAAIVERNGYDIVQAEYWYMGKLFERIDAGIFKVIDTHDVLFDKKRQEILNRYAGNPPALKRKELAKYQELEVKHLKLANLIISISVPDQKMFAGLNLGKENLLIPIGQDLEYFKNADAAEKKGNVLLFYGSMGGEENINAFFRLWRDIFPRVKEVVPDAQMLVVGANPPKSITSLHNGRDLIVTGFVSDVRDYLARAKVALIPLNVAAGFRGRAVDVMAMGIPVIGTHRALSCLEIEQGVHGFMTDSDGEMADYSARLLLNDELRVAMGAQCRSFAMSKYSIEATIGKLSDYYLTQAAQC